MKRNRNVNISLKLNLSSECTATVLDTGYAMADDEVMYEGV
jgi:hypothetical protein